jgi:hypothetical protein
MLSKAKRNLPPQTSKTGISACPLLSTEITDYKAKADFPFLISHFSFVIGPGAFSARRLDRALVPPAARGGQVRFLNEAAVVRSFVIGSSSDSFRR